MVKLENINKDELNQISAQIADAFFDYKYNSEDKGLIQFISARENMFTYISGIVNAAYKSGLMYTTSEKNEGYLILSGTGAGTVNFFEGLKMIAAEKRALGGFSKMKAFISACFSDGGSIETRMKKAKLKYLKIEVLVVRQEYQKQGFMKQMMDFAYSIASKNNVAVILDTDDKDKCERYEHLGMKLDRIRNCGKNFHMYDLICA